MIIIKNHISYHLGFSSKKIGFGYATKSGTTISINDITISPKKQALINQATEDVDEIEEEYLNAS